MGNQGGQGRKEVSFFPLACAWTVSCLSFSFQIKEEEEFKHQKGQKHFPSSR